MKNSEIKVKHKYTLGDTTKQTFCVRFDPNDKYIAAGQGDGSIKIFNVFTGKQSYTLNANMEEPMPITQIRYCFLAIFLNCFGCKDGDPCAHQV